MRILSSTSKPLTSPGRTEKFPPPLMRFLRSNVGSRSRGRTKSNLLFLRRKKAITSSNANGNETQEPTSPKVTCIGQVRVRRSRSSSKSSRKAVVNNQDEKDPGKSCKCSCCCCRCSCCCWFQKPTLCGLKLWRKPSCGKWFSFFNCRSVRVRTDSSKFGSNRFEPSVETTTTTTTVMSPSLTPTESATAHCSTTPPRNALLLTRCRSAPYRSSSLVCQIWGEKSEEEAAESSRALGIELISSSGRSSSDSSSSARDSTSKSRGNQDVGRCDRISLRKDDLGNCDDYQNNKHKQTNSCTTNENVDNNINIGTNSKEVKVIEGESEGEDKDRDKDCGLSSRMPLIVLMRSKSEPGRSEREKYDPVSSEFWKHRRSTPHSHADAID